MAYIRTKTIKGHRYKYLVESKREGHKVRQKHIQYVGKDGESIPQNKLPKDYKSTDSWHTKRERELLTKFGCKVSKGYGYDGEYKGKPVEVRSQRKDKRFRIQKDTHRELVKKDGYYIFDSPNQDPVMVKARDVDKMLPKGDWYKDRRYPHKFLTEKDIWGDKSQTNKS